MQPSTAAGADESATAAPDAPRDATRVSRLALRDGGIALAALSLFAAADTWFSVTGLGLARLLAVLDGFAVGVVLGILAHEWGHFAGARWSGGIAPTRPITSLFPIFQLDMERSDPAAFRAMGVGGNVAHWSVVLLLVLALPLDSAARVALVCGAFGFAVSASTTEFPILRRAYAGAAPVESFAGLSGAKLRRDRRIGAVAGLLLFLVL